MIENWKFYLAGKIAGTSVFIGSFFYLAMDSTRYISALMLNQPEGTIIQRDLVMMISSAAIYMLSNCLGEREFLEESLEAKIKQEPSPRIKPQRPIRKEAAPPEDLADKLFAQEDSTEELEDKDETPIETPPNYYKLGETALAEKDYSAAKGQFSKAVAEKPSAQKWYALAFTQYKLNEYAPAKESIEKSIRLDKQPRFFKLAGKIFKSLGDDGRAKVAFKHAETLEPKK